MIPSDTLTLPEKTAQRYVFLGRPRRVSDHAALQMSLAYSGQALGCVRDGGGCMWIGRVERCASLWSTCGTAQCREQLEEQAHDKQEETEHCPRKLAIGRRLRQRNTASPALQSPKFRTQLPLAIM